MPADPIVAVVRARPKGIRAGAIKAKMGSSAQRRGEGFHEATQRCVRVDEDAQAMKSTRDDVLHRVASSIDVAGRLRAGVARHPP
jgi:hypothetical protein